MQPLIAEKMNLGYHKTMKRFLIILLLLAVAFPVFAMETDGKIFLKKGKQQLENKKYEDAIIHLSRASKDIPLLGDYALLWLSDAYHEIGNHKESLNAIRTLLNKYPDSPLEKKARLREMKEAEETSADNIRQLFESYTRDYKGDQEVKYLYAQWLKKNSYTDQAIKVFKELYIGAGPFSSMAYNELDTSDIRVDDLLRRASNLMNAMEYRTAESVLKTALTRDAGDMGTDIRKALGQSLFRQKRYSEAAELYRQVKDKYWEMRSRYRAGEKNAIESSIEELLCGDDKKLASILISVASDKRREGKKEEAITLFSKVKDSYATAGEDALWGIGWTHYLNGEYKKASDIFSKLYDKFSDTKYLYWKGRSIEADGEDASPIFQQLSQKRRDYYSTLSHSRGRNGNERSVWAGDKRRKKTMAPVHKVVLKKMDRIDTLLEIGLSKEASAELVYLSRNTNSLDDVVYICSKLQELGQYKYSVRLAVRVPYTQILLPFLYPLAHWDIVEKLSEKYHVDPLLILAIVREESRFDSDARSSAGALGLMQLMPKTAYRFDKKMKLGIRSSNDILDVKHNLNLGTFYISGLIREFSSYAPAIASYNAGEDIVKQWLQSGKYKSADEFIEDIPYQETRRYVKKVLTTFFEYKRIFSEGEENIDFPIEKL
jgi:soluble lytic murein transglycosylase